MNAGKRLRKRIMMGREQWLPLRDPCFVMPESSIPPKLKALRTLIREAGPSLVAFSGGVDSALVLKIAFDELADRALACIGVSPSYPKRELRAAVQFARHIGAPVRLIKTREYLDPDYAANAANRCYFCKSHLHDALQSIAAAESWQSVLDGTNADDLGDDRPGIAAARQRGVRSPLVEAAVTKAEVRALAAHLDLPVADKPAMACLSSRVPHGTPITEALLQQIEQAEDVLVALGFTQYRVRHHDNLARIELPADDLHRALTHREQIVAAVREAGYQHVTLDLKGFRPTPAADAEQLTLLTIETAPAS